MSSRANFRTRTRMSGEQTNAQNRKTWSRDFSKADKSRKASEGKGN